MTAKVFHFDSFGKPEAKYEHLWNNSIKSINWTELPLKAPEYYFVQKDITSEEKYR